MLLQQYKMMQQLKNIQQQEHLLLLLTLLFLLLPLFHVLKENTLYQIIKQSLEKHKCNWTSKQ
jgi:hypothetical protein